MRRSRTKKLFKRILSLFLVLSWLLTGCLQAFFLDNSFSKPPQQTSGKKNELNILGKIIRIESDTEHFNTSQIPVFRIIGTKKLSLNIALLLKNEAYANTEEIADRIKTEVLDYNDKVVRTIPYGNIDSELMLNDLTPGKYALRISDINTGEYIEQDFTWGVLAINSNKSIYQIGDNAKLQMAVLDERGNMVCDASVKLQITNDKLQIKEELSTKDGTIKINEDCWKKGYTSKPDYEAEYVFDKAGIYNLELTADTANGKYTIVDTVEVISGQWSVDSEETERGTSNTEQFFDIERVASTRIYPFSNYPVVIAVTPEKDFIGTVEEKLPAELIPHYRTAAELKEKYNLEYGNVPKFTTILPEENGGEDRTIAWQVNWKAGETYNLIYELDFPDKSPDFYTTGGLKILDLGFVIYEENRQWQYAIDASGDVILLWDSATYGSVPGGWDCISCDAGDPYLNIYPVGAASYNGSSTGGAANHQHTPTYVSTGAASSTAQYDNGKTTGAQVPTAAHTHATPTALTAGTASNDPSNRTLLLIRSSGTPSEIPVNTIGLFDTTSLPTNWIAYSLEDAYFLKGGSTVGTGGLNTHVHSVSVTTGAASGSEGHRGGTSTGESTTHVHSGTGDSQSSDHQPPYLEMVFGRATSNTSIPGGIIAMFDADAPGGWARFSALDSKFVKANSSAYGGTGGNSSHTQSNSDITVNATANTNSTADLIPTTTGADVGHTHSVTVSFDNQTNLPIYRDTVFAKRDVTATITQNDWRIYVDNNLLDPADPWGNPDLGENASLTSVPVSNDPIDVGDNIRIRITMVVGATTLAASSEGFILQYGEGTSCSAISSWTDVDAISGSGTWRYYNNGSIADGTALSGDPPTGGDLNIGVADRAGRYVESDPTTTNPFAVASGEDMEWDFNVQYNGNAEAHTYCFKIRRDTPYDLDGYNSASYPQVDTRPGMGDLMRHGNFFTSGAERGFFWVD